MVTAATTASSVSPPFLRMSMPRPSAFTPLALEMMTGRLPCAGGAAARSPLLAAASAGRSNRLATPAAALPASEVRKNLRRDHKLIAPPKLVRVNIQQHGLEIRKTKCEMRSGFPREPANAGSVKAAARPPHSKKIVRRNRMLG